jgi:hypothetical protein
VAYPTRLPAIHLSRSHETGAGAASGANAKRSPGSGGAHQGTVPSRVVTRTAADTYASLSQDRRAAGRGSAAGHHRDGVGHERGLAITFHPRPTPAVGSGRDPATTREWIRAAHRSPAAGHCTRPTRGRRARNGLPESTGKQGDRPRRVASPTGAGAYPLLPGFVEGTGVGPQPDLVDHHRRHRDGVPARPRPLRVELFGHCAYLLEGSAMRPVMSSTLASSWARTLPSGIRVRPGVRPREVCASPGTCCVDGARCSPGCSPGGRTQKSRPLWTGSDLDSCGRAGGT